MGKVTSGLWGEAEGGGTVHCDGIRAKPCIEAYEMAGRPPAWLWIGNSQLHGINRYQMGEKSAPMALHDKLRPQGVYLVTHSLPNATIAEFVTLFHGIGRQYDLEKILIPVVLNGMRGGAVRASERPIFKQAETLDHLTKSQTFGYMKPIILSSSTNGSNVQEEEFSKTFEKRISTTLATNIPPSYRTY